MIRISRTALAGTLLLPVALIVAACGGGGGTTTTPVPTPPGAEVPVGAIPTFDLKALTGALPGVDSYRTSVSVNGVEQYQSVVVTQPEVSKAITTFDDDGTVDTRIIVIGDQAWTADGADGLFEAVPAALASSMLLAFDPAAMLGAYSGLDWASGAADQGTEDKNGVRARHLKIDPTTMVALAGVMPPGSSIDVWVADAGYLVAWEMSGFEAGQSISIQITDVNDPANVVEAPPS